jgi:hypothetical protein
MNGKCRSMPIPPNILISTARGPIRRPIQCWWRAARPPLTAVSNQAGQRRLEAVRSSLGSQRAVPSGMEMDSHARPCVTLARTRPGHDCRRCIHHDAPGIGLRSVDADAGDARTSDVFHPGLGRAETSVRALDALSPEVVVTGHGAAMKGREMRAALTALAERFATVAVPPIHRR